MARRALGVAFAIAALIGCSAADAQTLALLHLRSFDLSLDRSNVAVGEPFHLTLTTRVDDKLDSLENVQLPSFPGLENLGDERRCSSAKNGGTECVEIVTLDANAPGDQTIGPSDIEFVDATSGRIRTLESNVVTVHVTGTAKAPPTDAPSDEEVGPNPLQDLLWAGVRGLLIFLCVAVAGYALIWGYRRRPAPVPVPLAPPPPPQPATPWAERMRALGEMLAAEPTRERAVAVRSELRAHVGAGDRETIADLVRRRAAGDDAAVMTALAAVERAAFCEDANVAEAAREAVPFLIP